MSNKTQISIIGATGNLGVPISKYLSGKGFKVKAIVRNPGKARQLFSDNKGIEITKADLRQADSLQSALKDTEYLYLNLSSETTDMNISFAPEREGIANILKAVNRQCIKQILCITGLGALDNSQSPKRFKFIPNIIRKQGHKLLKESGIPYTILHCSWFIDSFILYRRNNRYAVIGDTQNPIYFINAYDYSEMLANAVGNPKAFNKEFPVQGNQGIQHPDAARQFLSAYSPDTKVSGFPSGLIAFLALFYKKMKFLKHMSDYFTKNTESFLVDEYQTYEILGQPAFNLREYAETLRSDNFYNYLNN